MTLKRDGRLEKSVLRKKTDEEIENGRIMAEESERW